MQISIQKLQIIVIGIISVGVIGVFGYFMYVVFFTGPKPEAAPSLAGVKIAALSSFPKIAKAAGAVVGTSQKILLKKKDYAFVDTLIYKSFTDDPIDVPLSDKRGRPDPFVPYVAP